MPVEDRPPPPSPSENDLLLPRTKKVEIYKEKQETERTDAKRMAYISSVTMLALVLISVSAFWENRPNALPSISTSVTPHTHNKFHDTNYIQKDQKILPKKHKHKHKRKHKRKHKHKHKGQEEKHAKVSNTTSHDLFNHTDSFNPVAFNATAVPSLEDVIEHSPVPDVADTVYVKDVPETHSQ